MKTKSLKIAMLVAALLSVMSVKAQTFVCSDVTFSDYTKRNLSETILYQVKKQLLGSIYTIEVFDKNLKIKATDTEGNKDEMICSNIGWNKYRFEETRTNAYNSGTWKLRTDIEIQTTLGYYSSIIIKNYRDGKLYLTMTAKRKR